MSASKNIKRRNFLKGLGMAPALAIAPSVSAVNKRKHAFKSNENKLRLGLIGFGFRGEQLARAMKFAHPDWIQEQEKKHKENSNYKVLEDFNNQKDLDVEIVAVSDVFDYRTQRGITASGSEPKAYADYRKLLKRKDIDAVVIATPDHWHARMAMDAAKAGKHVYLEKCMTLTAEEAVEVKNTVKEKGIIFQLGHQGRQGDLQKRAKDLYNKGILGEVSVVETTTNRNNPFAAWIWPIHEDANPETIDWEKFQSPAKKKVPFNAERFFRWRCWWDYGTGMAGDLFTHDYDAVNHIMELGIPQTANASGGIYYHKDGREVPDVFHANFEYKERGMTLLYSGTLSNGVPRGTMIMGHDASLELGQSLTVWADTQSTKYRSRIESGIIDPASPLVRFRPEEFNVDAVTSATSKYFADRGLMYTYQGGKRVDTTNLHLNEWVNCIKKNTQPSCNIDRGFEEAITAHMSTESFKSKKMVYWDSEKEKIIKEE